MRLLGVARANTAVGVSPETFLLLLQVNQIGVQCIVTVSTSAADPAACRSRSGLNISCNLKVHKKL
jgi:hypothetical protein